VAVKQEREREVHKAYNTREQRASERVVRHASTASNLLVVVAGLVVGVGHVEAMNVLVDTRRQVALRADSRRAVLNVAVCMQRGASGE